MLNFVEGYEIEKDVFSSCHESGTKKQSQTLTGLEPSWIRPLLRIFFLAHVRHKTKKCLSLIIFLVLLCLLYLFVCSCLCREGSKQLICKFPGSNKLNKGVSF